MKINVNTNLNMNCYKNENQVNVNKVDSNLSDIKNTKVKEKNDTSDSIILNETNKNIINAKKSKDAYNETVDKFSGKWYSCGSGRQNITGVIADIEIWGDISIDLDSNTPFTDFADKLMRAGKKLSVSMPEIVPSDFFDFCKSFKEALVRYNCR